MRVSWRVARTVCAPQTRGVLPSYVRVSRTLTPRRIGTICLIGIIVSVDGDDGAAN